MISLEKFNLENGLEVYYLYNSQSKCSFLQLWFHVGVFQEEKEKNGITHLLEHLFFKGTDKIKAEEFSRIIQKEGGNCNAFTTEEKVCFYETVPAEKLELIFELEADRMVNLNFSEEDFLKEKKVVLEEYKERIENQPILKPLLKIKKEIFGDHPFSMDPLGDEKTIENIKYEDVKEYYNDFFTPSNCTFIIVSSLEISRVKELLKKYFEGIKKEGKMPKELPKIERPKKDFFEEKIPIKASAYVKAYFIEKREELYFPLILLHHFLGAEEDSLLKKEIQEKKFYVFQAGTFPFFTSAGYIFVFFSLHLPFLKKYNFPEKINEFLKNKNFYSNEKFEKIKGRFLINTISSLSGSEKQGLYLSDCIILRGSPESFFLDFEKIRKLKFEEFLNAIEVLNSSPSCEVFLKGNLWKKF